MVGSEQWRVAAGGDKDHNNSDNNCSSPDAAPARTAPRRCRTGLSADCDRRMVRRADHLQVMFARRGRRATERSEHSSRRR